MHHVYNDRAGISREARQFGGGERLWVSASYWQNKGCACRFITEGHISTSRNVFVRTRESSRSLPTHCGPRHHTRRTTGAVVRCLSEGSLRQKTSPHAHKQLTHPQESNRPQKRNT